MEKPIRTSAKGNSQVGKNRQNVYEAAFAAYDDAMKHRYYVEAVGLIASLIEDRLESLHNELFPEEDHTLKTIGNLTNKLKGSKIQFFDDVIKQIDDWRPYRNDAIHQLAKLLEPEFPKHYESLKRVADEGKKLFRELDKQYKAYMRAKNREN